MGWEEEGGGNGEECLRGIFIADPFLADIAFAGLEIAFQKVIV